LREDFYASIDSLGTCGLYGCPVWPFKRRVYDSNWTVFYVCHDITPLYFYVSILIKLIEQSGHFFFQQNMKIFLKLISQLLKCLDSNPSKEHKLEAIEALFRLRG